MLKLKLQYFGHLMRRVDSLEKTLVLGGVGGINQELGMNIYTLLHGELYSIFYDNLYEKRIRRRMNMCVHITESLCCTPETNTIL